MAKVKLNIVRDGSKLVAMIQKECRTWRYDEEKVKSRLNCSSSVARDLISECRAEDEAVEEKVA